MFGRKPTVSSPTRETTPSRTDAAAALTAQKEVNQSGSVSQSSDQSTLILDDIRQQVLSHLDPVDIIHMDRKALALHINESINALADQKRWLITTHEQQKLVAELIDDILGVGPIQILIDDPSVTDIMVNGHKQVYVERYGQLETTHVSFRDEAHVRHVAQRMASAIGRRIDESSPMVDARLPDGSRVNIIIPPLALNGTCISIRKFNEQTFDLHHLAEKGSLSTNMADFLNIAAQSRLNILISGGTGAGKTTLLNALCHNIDNNERIITIEDSAELKLNNDQVIRLETRPASLEGQGQVSQSELVRNALRMNPRRIILGEVRGAEAFDMLQAMNTGHEGSMSTLHANSPRDAIFRLENMLLMAHGTLPIYALRQQIMSSVDLIIQVERMRDGIRRVTAITELVGLEDDTPIMHDLFTYKMSSTQLSQLKGDFECHQSSADKYINKVRYAGLEKELQRALGHER